MRKADRLKLWKKSGWTFRSLGLATNFDHQTLRRALLGQTRYPQRRVCEVLAAAVSSKEHHVSADEMFPPRTLLLSASADEAAA
jgi:lambda repressor-like predicted transcriptional regulator